MMATRNDENCPPSKPNKHAFVEAAMMEELGAGRKDRLPLEGTKGWTGQVNLHSLDKNRRANDPSSKEHKFYEKNKGSILAWNNIKFDDVDEADLALDEMNQGQSHRLRMIADMGKPLRGISTSTRGGHTQRVSRGGSSLRGRGNHSNFSRATDLSSALRGERLEQTISRLNGVSSNGYCSTTSGLASHNSNQQSKKFSEDKRSFNAQRALSNNQSTSKAVGRDKLQRSEGFRAEQLAKNNFSLVTPEEFLKNSWVSATKAVRHGGEKLEPSKLPTVESIRNTLETNVTKSLDASLREAAIRQPAENGCEILQEARVKFRYRSEYPTLDKDGITAEGNARLIRTTNQDGLVIFGFDLVNPILTLQCLASSVLSFKAESRLISFETFEDGILIAWQLEFQFSSVATEFRDELLQHIPKSARVGNFGSLITFLDKPEASTHNGSKFTEDLLSLIDDTSANDSLYCNSGTSDYSSHPVRETIKPSQAEITSLGAKEGNQSFLKHNFPDEQNISYGEDSNDHRSTLLKRYGGLAASRFAALEAEKIVPKFQSKSGASNNLSWALSEDYTNGTNGSSARPISGRLQDSPSPKDQSNGNKTGSVSSRITYSIEELMGIKQYMRSSKDQPQNTVSPTLAPPDTSLSSVAYDSSNTMSSAPKTTNATHTDSTGTRIKAKKPQGLAGSIFSDRKQADRVVLNGKNFKSIENVFSSLRTYNSENRIGVTNRTLRDGDSLPQGKKIVGQSVKANGLMSSSYEASANTISPSSETRRSTNVVSSELALSNEEVTKFDHRRMAPLTEVKITPMSENVSELLNTGRPKQKSLLNPICEDFLPSKNYSQPEASFSEQTVSSPNNRSPAPSLTRTSPNRDLVTSPIAGSPSMRYETFLLPDPVRPGHFQEVRGILKASIRGQFGSEEPNLDFMD